MDLKDNLDLDLSVASSNLSKLQGPIEPASLLDKGQDDPAVASVSNQNHPSAPILFTGTVFRYNYGFKLDFTERHLILTQDTLKYYRNE